MINKHVMTTVNYYLCDTLSMCNLQNQYYFFISASNVVVCQHENHLIDFIKAFNNEMLLLEQIYISEHWFKFSLHSFISKCTLCTLLLQSAKTWDDKKDFHSSEAQTKTKRFALPVFSVENVIHITILKE